MSVRLRTRLDFELLEPARMYALIREADAIAHTTE